MNKRQKEVQQAHLDEEKKIISQLERIYTKASADCDQKIRELAARTDMQNLQAIIYQKQYQEALKKQLDNVLDQLHTNSFDNIASYLAVCYENGFVGSMYDLQGQGIPLIIPVDQRQVVKALQTDSKLSMSMYSRLGEDVSYLKKSIRAELSRGISNGSTWLEIASHMANGMNSPFKTAMNNSMRIARTEGHRIQNQAHLDSIDKAKKNGADIIKQWDSTLDGRTRPEHREADGQIREIDEPFDVGGEKMDAPGVGGSARNVCNCRCCLLQRARWALDDDELKELENRAAYFGLDKTADFVDYKQKYLQASKSISLQDQVDNYLKGTSTDRVALGQEILKSYNVNGVPADVIAMSAYGYCTVSENGGILSVGSYNLNANDKRGVEYQVKTAFHEAYHASGNGYKTDIRTMDRTRWLDLEETFAESSAHYAAAQYGITDLAPSYAERLVKMLPRLKKTPEFSKCSTIADFGKVAQEARQAGGGSTWKQLSQTVMRKRFKYSSYVQQYFPEIRKDVAGYTEKILENMPGSAPYKASMISDLEKAMTNIEQFGTTLTSNEQLMLNNAVAVAMNRIGVK